MDGRGEARQSEADQLERPCSFRAAVQVVVALQRLQGRSSSQNEYLTGCFGVRLGRRASACILCLPLVLGANAVVH